LSATSFMKTRKSNGINSPQIDMSIHSDKLIVHI
jgi:hypothetical protein